MTDIRDEVRDLLQRKADGLPPERLVPEGLVGRARRRIARNALAVAAAIVLVAGGAFAGVGAVGGFGTGEPAGDPTETEAVPSPSVSASVVHPMPSTAEPSAQSPNPACTAGDLRAVATLEGAAGSRDGTFDLTNFSDRTCTLTGTPPIVLHDDQLRPIGSGVRFDAALPEWQANGEPRPDGWPVVTLRPGDVASVRIRWSNWCPPGRAAPIWQVVMTDGGTVDVQGTEEAGAPPCNGPGLPSTIEVGPFEPKG